MINKKQSNCNFNRKEEGDFFTITEEDVYEGSVNILLLKFGFSRLSNSEKVSTVVFFPLLYSLALIGFIVFGLITRDRRKKMK